jgi:hypothetical protein
MIDFSRSFFSWIFNENFIGRFQVESSLKINKIDGSESETYFLGSSVMACNVLKQPELFILPKYSFQPAFSIEKHKIFRYDQNMNSRNTIGLNSDVYNSTSFSIREIEVSELDNISNLYNCVINNEPIFCSIEYKAADYLFTLDFPVKHINYHLKMSRFQVETGPVLNSDSNLTLFLSYLAFNTFESFEILPINYTNIDSGYTNRKISGANIKLFKNDK